MSGDRYKIHDQNSTYFITCTVIKWIDLFTRKEYKEIIVDSLNYCVKEKGLVVYGWVIMSNHIHLLCRCKEEFKFSDFLRDFKKFTSKQFIHKMDTINESRKEWLLNKFSFEAKRTRRAENYKIWKDDNHAILMDDIDLMEKLNYIHENPVRAGLVNNCEDYNYSSAKDYAGIKGLVDIKKF